jgi:hypothetical protein
MHISDIEAAVGNAGNFQADMIYLVNEGMLYNTVDDQHFAAV